MFSRNCEYGIRACIYLAINSSEENKIQIGKIAERINAPKAFTSKILQQLVRHHMLHSTKGPYGGFYMTKDLSKSIHLIDIVELLDGKQSYTRCVIGLENCSPEKPCPLHEEFQHIRNKLKILLSNNTLCRLAEIYNDGDIYLSLKEA